MRPAPIHAAATPALAMVRGAIDRIDGASLQLLALRCALARLAAAIKRAAALPLRDMARETQVRQRLQDRATAMALPQGAATRLGSLLIGEACRAQGLAADPGASDEPPEAAKFRASSDGWRPGRAPATTALLGRLPPPKAWAIPLHWLPQPPQRRLLEAVLGHVLAGAGRQGALDFLDGRRLGIEVSDLGLVWVLTCKQGEIRACPPEAGAEATVRGTATDLLVLASRLEDADTLFFQRRLVLTGDTELGLTARNVLDRLDWATLPLALRIGLNRAARLAMAARMAHRRTDPRTA